LHVSLMRLFLCFGKTSIGAFLFFHFYSYLPTRPKKTMRSSFIILELYHISRYTTIYKITKLSTIYDHIIRALCQ
jgi:hypothetical protein